MTSNRCERTPERRNFTRFILLLLGLILGAMQANAVILFNQPHDGTGTIHQSSSWDPNGSDYDQLVWDRFSLSSDQAITAVNWRGGGATSSIVSFTVAIYASIPAGSQPDLGYLYTGPLVSYTTTGNAGQTSAGTFGGVQLYDYHFTLPSPFQATAGVPYWIYIVANQSGMPNWGFANGGSGSHFRCIANVGDRFYQIVSGDAAFSLVGSDQPTVTIAASVTPTSSGTIQGAGSYPIGSTVSLTAVPAANYGFVEWTEGGVSVSTSTVYSFTATTNQTFVAHFAPAYTVTTSSSPLAGGVTNGGGIFTLGSSVTVNAIANSGYVFHAWLEGGSPVSSSASYTFTIASSRNLVAQFTAQPASALFDFDTGLPSVQPYQSMPSTQTNAGLTATFSTLGFGFWSIQNTIYGFVPSNFSGNFLYPSNPSGSIVLSFSQPLTSLRIAFCTAEVSSEYDIASLVRITGYATSTTNPAIGSASARGDWISGPYPEGSVTFSSATQFSVIKIDIPSGQGYPVSNYLFVDNIVAQQASPPPTRTITTSASPTAGGFVTGAGVYTLGSLATLEAVSNNGYSFINWTEGGVEVSTSSVYSFDATANRTLVAHFGQDWYITTIASPPEGGVTYGDGFYTSGTPVTVSAIPNPGYDFVNWTESGTAVSTLADYSFTSTSARTLSANFAFTQYSLTTIVQPVNAGTATGAGSYASGNYASIWAGPNSGYVFQQWEMNGVPFSNQQSESIWMDSNHVVTAVFAPAITITISGTSPDGIAYGAGEYAIGQSVELRAVPHTGRAFRHWLENGFSVSDASVYRFTASTARTLTAVFEADTLSATFDFDTGTPSTLEGDPMPATQTSGGWSARFSAPSGTFAIHSETSTGWRLSNTGNHYLFPTGSPSELFVLFDRSVGSVHLSFATLDFQQLVTPSEVRLTAWSDSAGTQLIGVVTAVGIVKPGDLLPTGTLSLQASNIRLIKVDMPTQTSGTTDFVIDNISVRSVPQLYASYQADLDPTTVTLSWQAPCSGYSLQTTTDLIPANWQTVTTSVTTMNNQNRVAVHLSGTRGYYRLFHP